MEIINKKTLEKTAELAKIEIAAEKEEKLLKDLSEIINYFEELKKIDTSNVRPLSGGVLHFHAGRDDEKELKSEASSADLTDAFLEKENNFLKVPGVFE